MYYPLASEASPTKVAAMSRIGLHILLVFALLMAQVLHVSAGATEAAIHHHGDTPTADAEASPAPAGAAGDSPMQHAGDAIHCHLISLPAGEQVFIRSIETGRGLPVARLALISHGFEPPTFPPKA